MENLQVVTILKLWTDYGENMLFSSNFAFFERGPFACLDGK